MSQKSDFCVFLRLISSWVCSGEAKFFQQVEFPPIKTFDNSATPTGDLAEVKVRTAPVDVEKLRTILGDAAKEAEANDPKALRAEIARLKGELAKKPQVSSNPGELADVEQKAERAGYDRGIAEGMRRGWEMAVSAAAARNSHALAQMERPLDEFADASPPISNPSSELAKINKPAPKGREPAPTPLAAPAAASGDLTGPQRTVLRALAWWALMGKDWPSRNQVAIMCGWSTNSSNIRDRCSELSRLGMIDRPEPGKIALTAIGAASAPDPGSRGSLHENLRAILTGPQRQVFAALLDAGGKASRDALAVACGWSTNSSNIRDRLSELARLDIIERPSPGVVALQAWVNE